MKKIFILILTLSNLFILTGCWDYESVDNSVILGGLGIDKVDDKYKLSLEILIPIEFTQQQTSASPVKIIEFEAENINELRTKFANYISTYLFYRNLRIVVLSKAIVEEGVDKVLDPLLRHNDLRFAVMLMTLDDDPKDVLSTLSPVIRNQSESLRDSLSLSSKFGNIPKQVNIVDVAGKVLNDGEEPYIPIVTIKGDTDKGKEYKDLEQTELKTYTEVSEIGLFSNNKYVDKLTTEETQIISYLLSNPFLSIYGFKDEECNYSIYTSNNKTDIKATYNGKPEFDIKLTINASLIEVGCPIKINEEKLREIEVYFENEMRKQIRHTLIKTQNHKSDILGLGETLRRQDKAAWKKIKNKWMDEYSDAEFKVRVNVKLENTGVLSDPVSQKE